MAGQGSTLERVDSRAGVVAARENAAADMIHGRSQWNTAQLREWAETVYSVYIPSQLGRFFFKRKSYAQALKYLELARSRELSPDEQAELDKEIAEVKAAMAPQAST